MEVSMANTNGKAARKKIGGNRHSLKKRGRSNNIGKASYAVKQARWRAMAKKSA